MKKTLVAVLTIFFVVTIALLNLGYFTDIQTMAVGAFNMLRTSVPYSLIKDYEGDNLIKKKEAETELKKICLTNLEYSNWENYLDYIELSITKGNVLPNGENELIVALNLSKDLAAVCVFSDNSQSYDFVQKIDNLLPIESIKMIKIPGQEFDFLVIYQIADERLGAYYYEKFLEVYMYNDGAFRKKLRETIFYEEIYKSIWIDQSAPADEWNKNTIKNNVLFIENSNLYIDVSGTKNKLKATGSNSIPRSSDFKLVDSSSYKYKYYWNREFQEFSRKEDTVIFNSTQGFIIGDSETDVKNLRGFSKNKYKLLTVSGKILYIDKELIDEKTD